jgi:hypothetical protein
MRAAFDLWAGVLGQTLYFVLMFGAALSVVIGFLLLVDSARVLRWNGVLNGWVSNEAVLRRLDEPHDVKRVLYRGHRISGLLVIAGALYALPELWWPSLPNRHSTELAALVFESLRLFLIVGNLAALAAGAVVFFRPSLLKPLESWADRVYRSRMNCEGADKMRLQPDEFAKSHPWLLGVLAAVSGVYLLVSLSFFCNT